MAAMRVWFAREDLKGGKKFHDRLLIVPSEHSIQSEWVMTEIRKARETEKKEKRRKLFRAGRRILTLPPFSRYSRVRPNGCCVWLL